MCSKWRVIKIGWSYFRVILIFEKRLISAWINVRRGANQLSLKQASAFIIWHTRRWLHAPLLLLLRSLAASQPPYWPQDWGCSTPRSQRKHARSLQPPTAKLYRPPAIRFLESNSFWHEKYIWIWGTSEFWNIVKNRRKMKITSFL